MWFVLSDTLGTIIEKVTNVSTVQYTMFFREGGAGVAVGKVCENIYSFEVNGEWAFRYGANRVYPMYFDYNNTPPPAPVDG